MLSANFAFATSVNSPSSDSSPGETASSDTRVRDLRREIIAAETQISELQDQSTRRETEQADAVALLGQVELVLEQKIGYIIELDQTLNTRIRELEIECERKSEEIESRGKALLESEVRDEKNRTQLTDTRSRLSNAENTLAEIKASVLWKLARPWRALFGPKS